MEEENLAGAPPGLGTCKRVREKEPGIKCQEEPRATQLVQSLLWEELFYLTVHLLGRGLRCGAWNRMGVRRGGGGGS